MQANAVSIIEVFGDALKHSTYFGRGSIKDVIEGEGELRVSLIECVLSEVNKKQKSGAEFILFPSSLLLINQLRNWLRKDVCL